MYYDYQRKQLDETNEKVSASLQKQFAGLMKNIELIEDDDSLENDLNELVLFQRDMKNVIGSVTPYIPYIGIINGAICIITHIWKKKKKTEEMVKTKKKIILPNS